MNQSEVIDVTKIEPRLKHPTIFNSFDALAEGNAILIHNDHDPKPLYYQLIAERGNIFSWSYVTSGPAIWEVEIRKNIAGDHVETIGEIAAKDLRKAEVFKKYGLDFCCGGKKVLEDACKEKGLDVVKIKQELENTTTASISAAQHDFNSWNLSFLADYIVNVHHAYVKHNMPILSDLTQKVAEHHGATNPELKQIRDKADEMFSELKVHMKKEETILFPYIKQLDAANLAGGKIEKPFNTILQPISVMENDHEIVGKLAEDIRLLSSNFALPDSACNSYALLYKKLEEFEADLHTHIHLENNILFPKAIELERNS
ncbi:MAG: iron-sulfur cluster repair di-iron protein [Bacteroidetes bacterium]|nr:iron-sulfur cluster repair di-iron protein [Bacteroidota bacterium]